MAKKLGQQTIVLDRQPVILSGAGIVGKKEGDGPLARYFDNIIDDEYAGEKTFEAAESRIMKDAYIKALEKSGKSATDISLILSGDLLNQCTAASYAFRDVNTPYMGLFGACSTMSESLAIAAMLIDGGSVDYAVCAASSHFCSAERQFRFPLEYGNQRTPTSQWTVTGAGAVILGKDGQGPKITCVTPGMILDEGIKDSNNMGAAMAPAACDTIMKHLRDTGRTVDDLDMILTGDLGKFGSEMLRDLLLRNNIDLKNKHKDCGMMIYDLETQNVDCGGSGCGCSAVVFSTYILDMFMQGIIKRLLFIATGALLSPTRIQQGETIPGIAHAVLVEA
ncbi:MAG TPA: stage V sporulation protein AD [Clostridiaceae bacterium]|nr:stage V sporulation protein AD [Clostridiaceae bacterium]